MGHKFTVSVSPVKITFYPAHTNFTTVAELAFLHSLHPFLVVHSSPPAVLASLYVGDYTQAKIQSNFITSSSIRGLTYSPGSRNPQRFIWGSGWWWSQMPSVLEPAVLFVWPVPAVTDSQFATVEIFVCMHYSGCATQVSLPTMLELAPSCHSLLCLFHGKSLLWP